MQWPTSAAGLVAEQHRLATLTAPPWQPGETAACSVAAAWVCFERGASGPGAAGDPAWAAAVVLQGRHVVDRAELAGVAAGRYQPGLLALRVGPLLAAVVTRLAVRPDVLLVDATGRDHPRRAGLAVHLGVLLDVPTVGVTHRPLLATGAWPDDLVGAHSPLTLDGEVVGCWLRTRAGRRPVAVHAGWRTDVDTAAAVVLAGKGRMRTPRPLREARRAARHARAAATAG